MARLKRGLVTRESLCDPDEQLVKYAPLANGNVPAKEEYDKLAEAFNLLVRLLRADGLIK